MTSFLISFATSATVYSGVETRPNIACNVFGKEMRELRLTATEPCLRKTGAEGVSFSEYTEGLAERGVKHLAIRGAVSDTQLSTQIAPFCGSPLVVAERYSFFPRKQEIRRMKMMYPILTTLSAAHRSQLLSLSRKAFSFSRFYRDPYFEPSACDQLYEEIVRALFALPQEEFRIVIATRGEDAVGYIVGRRRMEERDGKTCAVTGSGFGAVVPGHEGCFVNLVEAGLKHTSADSDVIEFDSQSDNAEAQKIYAHFGMMKTLREQVWHLAIA